MNPQMCPHGCQSPDRNLLGELEVRLQTRLGSQICGLRVVSCSNGLTLQGRSRSYYAKQLAQHALMDESDLPIIANEIEVA